MMTRAPVVLIGLDACDPAIAQRLAREGQLPCLAKLFAHSARCVIRNPYGLFVSALWMTFATGLRPDRHRYHSWDEIEVASYERRLTTPPSAADTAFWRKLSEAGRRVAVLDVPHSRADAPVNGLQVVEWGCHDRHFGFHTWPPKAAADIDAAFGLHPVLGVDAYAARQFAPDDYAHRAGAVRTVDEDRMLLDDLLRGVKAKQKFASTILAEGGWDLFVNIFGESHAIGHQQWHLHDASHPRFDPARAAAIGGDPIVMLYRELDAALGETLALTPDDATVLVLLSHGMGPHYDGTHLLDEILGRIDRFDRGTRKLRRRHPVHRAKAMVRDAWEGLVTAFAVPGRPWAAGLLPSCTEYAEPVNRARQAFFSEPNNTCYAGIRLNLKGREPMGCVAPDEFDAVCARLTEDLHALKNFDTGAPVIRGVERSDKWYRRAADDTMPDLFVRWDRSAPIETVSSPKTGIVHARYLLWRTGDHRPSGLLLAYGPGIPTNALLPEMALEDLAPSIAARLGVTLDDVDGRAGLFSSR
jgi:predicted AlkP superfamily phosphohydrolase/phosphomutase